jgi:hypothetical protein
LSEKGVGTEEKIGRKNVANSEEEGIGETASDAELLEEEGGLEKLTSFFRNELKSFFGSLRSD